MTWAYSYLMEPEPVRVREVRDELPVRSEVVRCAWAPPQAA